MGNLAQNALTQNWVGDGHSQNKTHKLVDEVIHDTPRLIGLLKNTSDKQTFLLAYQAITKEKITDAAVLAALQSNRLYDDSDEIPKPKKTKSSKKEKACHH